jgi:hypothetical protein
MQINLLSCWSPQKLFEMTSEFKYKINFIQKDKLVIKIIISILLYGKIEFKRQKQI